MQVAGALGEHAVEQVLHLDAVGHRPAAVAHRGHPHRHAERPSQLVLEHVRPLEDDGLLFVAVAVDVVVVVDRNVVDRIVAGVALAVLVLVLLVSVLVVDDGRRLATGHERHRLDQVTTPDQPGVDQQARQRDALGLLLRDEHADEFGIAR